MKRSPRSPRPPRARDPLFNNSVQKALAILESFGGERRARSLAELAAAVGITTSSAQRCTHTLVRLGFLRRDARARRWVLTPRALILGHAYLSGHTLLEQATTHLIDLNQASGESVSMTEPDGSDMVFIARFPSLKRFYIHTPVGPRPEADAWSDQECYRGDLTIAAAILGEDGVPVASVNISAPTSRWTLAELRSKLAPVLLQTARAASRAQPPRLRRP